MSEPIAILCSDLHLSHRPPTARSGEKSWYAAMLRVLAEVQDVAYQFDGPVICAGDVFDKWNSPPELINWAIRNLPCRFYAVPGQHDLPNHNLKEIHRSAYQTLVESEVMRQLPGDGLRFPEGFEAYGFGWEEEVQPPSVERESDLKLAVVHEYVWAGKHKYQDAPEESHVMHLKKALEGYDAAVFGDNHIGFELQVGTCAVLNNGTMMRRHSNEKDYRPCIGILMNDGTIKRHYLNTDEDVFTPTHKSRKKHIDLSLFVKELSEDLTDSLDFRAAVDRYLKKRELDKETVKIILECLE